MKKRRTRVCNQWVDGVVRMTREERPMVKTIRFRGRVYPVLGAVRINGRRHLLLKRLTGGGREKFLAYCRDACPGGDLRMVHQFVRSASTLQQLSVFKRIQLGKFNFPNVLEYEVQGNKIALVTEWIWGESLWQRFERSRRRPGLWPSAVVALRLFR